jgi:hypothetical protein
MAARKLVRPGLALATLMLTADIARASSISRR